MRYRRELNAQHVAVFMNITPGCADETPVFANTGVKFTNVRDFLAVANATIVGSDLKVDGGT